MNFHRWTLFSLIAVFLCKQVSVLCALIQEDDEFMFDFNYVSSHWKWGNLYIPAECQ